MSDDNIYSLQAARETRDVETVKNEPPSHLEGPAKCLACNHEWIAVTPVGEPSFDLVCPSCDTRRGQYIYPPGLPDYAVTWRHKCGSCHFSPILLDKQGAMVRSVGYANTVRCEMRMLCHGCGEVLAGEDLL